ncbi:MAG TPA: hypothetical protein PLU52_06520 [Opitutaceae bacterium]|nr:hypothetical protein [Opitutaceae bacterium]
MALIDWQDFTQGYGEGDSATGAAGAGGDVAELNKALSAGGGNGGTHGVQTAGALGPLMPESLDPILTSMTYTEAEFKFWKGVYKDPAYNTAEEYNRLHKVGAGESAFVGEGDLPEEEDSTYSREVTLVKFMGTTRRVTHVASLVKTAGIENAIAQETKNGTLWLMRQLEESLFFGNSAIVPVQFDGLDALMAAGGTPTYDMRGDPLSEEVLSGMCAAVRQAPNYGMIDTIFCSIGVKSDIKNRIRSRLRANFGGQVDFEPKVDGFAGVKIEDNVFIQEGQAPYASGLGKSSKRPLVPAVGAAGLTSPVDATAQFAAGDAGTYIYKIVAINRYGRSAPVTTAGVAVAAGDNATIPVVDGGQDTTGYIVYRSEKNGAASTCKEAFRVARSGATQDIIDRNAYLPGCSTVFGLETKPATLGWKQLAPFTKIPLATVDLSYRWMQVLYGALQLKAPRHCFRIINVGRDPNAPVLSPAVIGFE